MMLLIVCAMHTELSVREQINRVVSHPTLPLTITAHEDHHLRFFDNNSGLLLTLSLLLSSDESTAICLINIPSKCLTPESCQTKNVLENIVQMFFFSLQGVYSTSEMF